MILWLEFWMASPAIPKMGAPILHDASCEDGKVSSPVEFSRNLWMIILGLRLKSAKKHMSNGENYNIYILC